MTPGHILRIVALYEAKTVWRSWFFRIFSGLSLLIIILLDIVQFATPFAQWMNRGMGVSVPYMNLVLFNVAQAVIGVFLAAEFLKFDRSLDTTEAVYARSMTNTEYVLGKTLGVLAVFVGLNVVVLAVSFVFNFFFTEVAVVPKAYLFYPLLLSLPTLLFIFGLSFLVMTLVRSQAVTFVLLLGYIAGTLFFLGGKAHGVFDYIGLRLPLMYSDFIGFGGLTDTLLQRGGYLLLGLGFIFSTALLIRRLVQSRAMRIVSAALAIAFICGGLLLFGIYLKGFADGENLRAAVRAMNANMAKEPPLSLDRCALLIAHKGGVIEGEARLSLSNKTSVPVDCYRFSLNPGFLVLKVTRGGETIPFERELQMVTVRPPARLAPGAADSVVVFYRGAPDERACYADLDESTRGDEFRFWVYSVGKRYGIVTPRYVLLTSECLWYPAPGVPYGAAYPALGRKDFPLFTLRVTTSSDLTVISQGKEENPRPGEFLFTPETRLPRISLVIGRYKRRAVAAEGIEYRLYSMPGHDYFMPYLGKIKDKLPGFLDETMADYERRLQISYPFPRLCLVEVPIQFCAYPRIWKADLETAQPEQMFLPEKGVFLRSADFKLSTYGQRRFARTGGQTQTEEEFQGNLFRGFARSFTGQAMNFRGIRQSVMGRGSGINSLQRMAFSIAAGPSIEWDYSVFPQFYGFVNHIHSDRYPVFDMALENYLKDRISQNMRGFRFFQGTTDAERANLELAGRSLADILADPAKLDIAPDVLKNKGNYLFALVSSAAGADQFGEFLSDYLYENRFRDIEAGDFARALNERFTLDIDPILDSWYTQKGVPAYVVSDVACREVLDSDRTRYQVTFSITNTAQVDGVVAASFAVGGGGRGGQGGQRVPTGGVEFMMIGADANTRSIILGGGQTKVVGALFDSPPRRMTIDTFISRNLPSTFSKNFDKPEKQDKSTVFEGERVVERAPATVSAGEVIVDNEDKGFRTLSTKKKSFLKNLLRPEEQEEDGVYIGFRLSNPPSFWRPTIMDGFYGIYRRSAYYIKAGDGAERAVWQAEITEPGKYNVYAYAPSLSIPSFRRGGQSGQVSMMSDFHYLVHNDDGVEEVILDMKNPREGWMLLGTYNLSAGNGEVELTNKTGGRVVIADAVKWVKQNESGQGKKQ